MMDSTQNVHAPARMAAQSTVRPGAIARLLVAATLLLASASHLTAQDARLQARLDSTTLAAVTVVLDSARADRLPTEPLVQKALEGRSKGAPGPAIARAVSALRQRLLRARAALGDRATAAELVAGAGALSVGVTPGTLEKLRNAAGSGRLSTPLVVLSDLVQRGVPPDTASGVVLSLAELRLDDDGFAAFRLHVEQDIGSGAAPATAAMTRARSLILQRRNR